MNTQEGLAEFAVLPQCQWADWMPVPVNFPCLKESVRKVRAFTIDGLERDFKLCHEHAEYVENYTKKELGA